ncbi:MAG TPA: hypothetical protein VGB20_05540 [bacterium]
MCRHCIALTRGWGWPAGALAASGGMAGCAALWAGAGAGGAATAYEVNHARELRQAEEAHEEGRMSREAYETRKDAIEDQSMVS